MSHLPVIVGVGGINAAGRSSFHHSYRRLVIDRIPQADAEKSLCNLAVLMGLIKYQDSSWQNSEGKAIVLDKYLSMNRQTILNNTLIRKLEDNLHDHNMLRYHIRANLQSATEQESFSFSIRNKDLPYHIPDNWYLTTDSNNSETTQVEVTGDLQILLKDYRKSSVQCAGQLPTGFKPGQIYPSRNHPRGLQLTVFGASDAIDSMGIDWELIRSVVPPDQISV